MAKRRAAPAPTRQEIEWDFNTFPTLYAFAGGALLSTLLIAFGLLPIVFVASLFGFSFCSAHAISHFFLRNRRRRARELAEEQERERRVLAARGRAGIGDDGANEGAPPTPARRRRRRR